MKAADNWSAVKDAYAGYLYREFGIVLTETPRNLGCFGIAYTELGNETACPAHVLLNLEDPQIIYAIVTPDSSVITSSEHVRVDDIRDMFADCSFDDIISPLYDLLPDEL